MGSGLRICRFVDYCPPPLCKMVIHSDPPLSRRENCAASENLLPIPNRMHDHDELGEDYNGAGCNGVVTRCSSGGSR